MSYALFNLANGKPEPGGVFPAETASFLSKTSGTSMKLNYSAVVRSDSSSGRYILNSHCVTRALNTLCFSGSSDGLARSNWGVNSSCEGQFGWY
jgi:hypothetical protein